jgi:hypothetical protein
MQDVQSMMDRLKRPKLLIRAARMGAEDYKRETHLPRVLGYGQLPKAADALMRLMQREAALNDQRKTQDASYSLPCHLDVLIAMVGESRILRASQISRARHGHGPGHDPT